jgi:tetratricopeptide (TPR) repeat protein
MVSRRELLFGFARRFGKNIPVSGLGADVVEADRLFASGNWEAARERYRAVLQAERTHHEARVRLGICFYKMGDFLQAKDTLALALRHRPGDLLAQIYLGLAYARRGHTPKALAAWEGFMDPANIDLTREVNLWRALADASQDVDPQAMADAVEAHLS